jgi:replicative DNA helicase
MSQAAAELSKRPLHLNRKTWATVEDVRNWARKVKGLKLIVIDYFGLLRHNGKAGSRYEAMTEISGQLKSLARSLKVPILCLAQLNRENMQRKGMKPQLSDLRDTGALEQDADGVIFLHRPDYYGDGDNPTPGVTSGPVDLQVILAKNRHGATGSINMDFYLKTGKIVPSSYS